MTGHLPRRDVDVLVVGGGVAGATLLHALARRGADCLLVDEGVGAAAGASSVPAALLNPNRGRSAKASPADRAGLTDFWALTDALAAEGWATGARRSGVLRVADNPRQARRWQRLADEPASGATWLPAAEVPGDYHAPFGALLVRAGGWVSPPLLLAALAASAAALGAPTARGVGVTGLLEEPTAVAVETTAGPIRARRVALCLGAARPPWLRLPRLETVWGEAVVLTTTATPPYPLAGSVVAAFGPGVALVSGGHSATPPTADDAEGAHPLTRALAWQVPAVAQATEVERWRGARAKRASGEPVARRLTARTYLLGALGGRGFLRAATLATRVAERLNP